MHGQSHIRVGSAGWHAWQGSEWMKCSSASPGQQRALAALKANASQVASAIAQQLVKGYGVVLLSLAYVRLNLEHSSDETWKIGESPVEGWRN